MKLYYMPGACSLAPHIVLNELGKTHSLEKVDGGTKKTAGGEDFNTINSKGYVPTLDIGDGEVLTEVAAILQYLVDKSGNTELLPKAGTMERYRAMETLNFIASEMHKGLGGLFYKPVPEARKAIIEKFSKRLDWLEAKLGKGNYILGNTYSAADAYAFTVLNWAPMLGFDLKPWKNISSYVARIAARPAVQAALKAEGLAVAA
ncbi:MAG: glutathione transferase GstA [Rhizobiales bacterium]|nr:glutathione transferase GstA [Hyphomicrobiales bacterium]